MKFIFFLTCVLGLNLSYGEGINEGLNKEPIILENPNQISILPKEVSEINSEKKILKESPSERLELKKELVLQENIFPSKIKDYGVENKKSNLKFILFKKDKLSFFALNNQDLIDGSNQLNEKIIDYFKPKMIEKIEKKKQKNGKIVDIVKKELSSPEKGILLISKYFFISKDKPYKLNQEDFDDDLQEQVNKDSICNGGTCITSIIMGINFFDEKLNIKPLDIKDFSQNIASKDNFLIHADYEKTQNGIFVLYYFYEINGAVLNKDKNNLQKILNISRSN